MARALQARNHNKLGTSCADFEQHGCSNPPVKNLLGLQSMCCFQSGILKVDRGFGKPLQLGARQRSAPSLQIRSGMLWGPLRQLVQRILQLDDSLCGSSSAAKSLLQVFDAASYVGPAIQATMITQRPHPS